jgi:predicted GIY-YIG superfamily endonuclease
MEKKYTYPKRIKWTIEICKQYASQYETRTDFRNGCRKAYDVARKNDWLDEVCKDMKTFGDKYRRLIYAFEFSDKSVYIGLTNDFDRRIQEHTLSQMTTVRKYILNNNVTYECKKLTDYIDVNESKIKEGYFLRQYHEEGWSTINKCKTGGIGKVDIMWDFESCRKEAKKYKQRTRFKEGSKSAYGISVRNGWLDEICDHMIDKFQSSRVWNFETCKNEAKKYKSRAELYKKNQSAYNVALKNGWLDKIYYLTEYCLHNLILDLEMGVYYNSFSEIEKTIGLSRFKIKKMSRFKKL